MMQSFIKTVLTLDINRFMSKQAKDAAKHNELIGSLLVQGVQPMCYVDQDNDASIHLFCDKLGFVRADLACSWVRLEAVQHK